MWVCGSRNREQQKFAGPEGLSGLVVTLEIYCEEKVELVGNVCMWSDDECHGSMHRPMIGTHADLNSANVSARPRGRHVTTPVPRMT
jgi:hypothetical protein